eukprot:692404-Amphidinium_carterae.1
MDLTVVPWAHIVLQGWRARSLLEGSAQCPSASIGRQPAIASQCMLTFRCSRSNLLLGLHMWS